MSSLSATSHLLRGPKLYSASQKLKEHLLNHGRKHKSLDTFPCFFQCPSISLPEPLESAAINILRNDSLSPPKFLKENGKIFSRKLWERKANDEDEYRRYLYGKLKNKMDKSVSLTNNNETVDDDVDETMDLEFMRRAVDKMPKFGKTELKKLVNEEMLKLKPQEYTSHNVDLYLANRLSPNFAVSVRVLYEIYKRLPNFVPKNLLDFGSGLGSCSWAATLLWPNELQTQLTIDASSAMNNFAARLIRGGRRTPALPTNSCLPGGIYQRHFLPAPPQKTKSFSDNDDDGNMENIDEDDEDGVYDIVISQHSLLDIVFQKNRDKILDILWKKTSKKGFLVLTEQGTRAGYQLIMEARNLLTDPKRTTHPAHIFAPCPHSFACPRAELLCNAYVRYMPLALTEKVTMQKEQFSYLILTRHDWSKEDLSDSQLPRIVSYKLGKKNSQLILNDLCTSSGEMQRVVFTKAQTEKDLFFYLRMCKAGDQLPTDKKELEKMKEEQKNDDLFIKENFSENDDDDK